MNWYKHAQTANLLFELNQLKPQMAQAAQEVYDQWDDDYVEFMGQGGICDEIAREIGDVIASSIYDVDIAEGGQEGDDHAWIIAYNNSEMYGVDIPHSLYEVGSGYSWQKIDGVIFSPNNIEIWPINDINREELIHHGEMI